MCRARRRRTARLRMRRGFVQTQQAHGRADSPLLCADMRFGSSHRRHPGGGTPRICLGSSFNRMFSCRFVFKTNLPAPAHRGPFSFVASLGPGSIPATSRAMSSRVNRSSSSSRFSSSRNTVSRGKETRKGADRSEGNVREASALEHCLDLLGGHGEVVPIFGIEAGEEVGRGIGGPVAAPPPR